MPSYAKSVNVYKNDLPDDMSFTDSIAVDTETLGLVQHRDRLCTIQISDLQGNAHIVHFSDVEACLNAKNLKRVLSDQNLLKIFHFARFDISVIALYLNVWALPCYCTKIASKVARTYTSDHGLKHLVKEFCSIELDKTCSSSFWGGDTLSEQQIQYAVNDVVFLHAIKEKLDKILHLEERFSIVENCCLFLQTRAKLDIQGWTGDIFSH